MSYTICDLRKSLKSYVLSLKSQQSIKHLNSDGEQLVGEVEMRVVQGWLLCAGADAEERPGVVLCQDRTCYCRLLQILLSAQERRGCGTDVPR